METQVFLEKLTLVTEAYFRAHSWMQPELFIDYEDKLEDFCAYCNIEYLRPEKQIAKSNIEQELFDGN